MLNFILIIALSGLAAFQAMVAPAFAHDWYPVECCAHEDCRRADSVSVDASGNITASVGHWRFAVPASAARLSRDAHYHVCFRTFGGDMDGTPTVVPICLFIPGQS